MEAETEEQDPFSLPPVNIQLLRNFLHMIQDIHHTVHWAGRAFIPSLPWQWDGQLHIFYNFRYKIVNRRNTNTNRIIENDEEREVEDDGELKSFLINGMADEEDSAEECSWRRQSFNNYSPKSYSPKHVSEYTFVDNEPAIPWVTSNRDPSVFSEGFKEGGKRRKKKHKEVYKKSTKRNR